MGTPMSISDEVRAECRPTLDRLTAREEKYTQWARAGQITWTEWNRLMAGVHAERDSVLTHMTNRISYLIRKKKESVA